MRDHTGLVLSCEAEIDRSLPTPDESIWVEGSLEVNWAVVLDNCWPRDTTLEFWPGREPGQYILAARMTRSASFVPGGPLCDAATGVHTAHLTLSPRVLATDVEAFVTLETADAASGSDWIALQDGAIELSINATKTVYPHGEAVEVGSSLTSDFDVTLECAGFPSLAMEQLDGALEFRGHSSLLSCPPDIELGAGDRLGRSFAETVSVESESGPLAEYIRDGQLFLPPGTYRFTARASFGVALLSVLHRLEASVVVTVR
jgi:hypothetical protein